MKKLALILILMCSFQILAQEKPMALKFDEFSSYPNQSSPLTNNANRFAKQLLKEPKTSRAVIIYYNQRKDRHPLDQGADWADYTSGVLTNGYQIPKERILVVDGGHREYATLEYWIVAKNAETPKPLPAFDKSELVICPQINIAGDGFRRDRKEPLKFSAAVKGEAPGSKLNFEWNVSAGKIIKGQGTNQIEVDLSETKGTRISASVQLKGLHPECESSKFASTEVGFFPYKVDEFPYIPYSDLAARLQGLYMLLAEDPTATMHIILYGSRDGSKTQTTRTIKNISQALDFMRFDTSRIKIVDGGFREQMMGEIFIVPAGGAEPKPTPTVDAKFVQAPKVQKKSARRG